MVSCKLSLCFLFLALLGACSAALQYRPPVTTGPRVSIEKVDGLTASQQLDAVDFLKRAYSVSSDRCSLFRQLFTEKYPQYKWHVIQYKAYSITYLKSITLKVDNTDSYVLFATKK